MDQPDFAFKGLLVFEPYGIGACGKRLPVDGIPLVILQHGKFCFKGLQLLRVGELGVKIGEHTAEHIQADAVALQAAVPAPYSSIKRDAQHDFIRWRITQGVLDRALHKAVAGYRAGLAALPALIIGHNHQIIRVPGECLIVIGAMPAVVPSVWVGSDSDGDLFFSGDFLPQCGNQTGVGIPLRMGHVFNIDVYSI